MECAATGFDFACSPLPFPGRRFLGWAGPGGGADPAPPVQGRLWRTRGAAPSAKKRRWWYNRYNRADYTTDRYTSITTIMTNGGAQVGRLICASISSYDLRTRVAVRRQPGPPTSGRSYI